VTRQTEHPHAPDLNQARDTLREGLDTSRKIVRQSRELIELSESDGAAALVDQATAPSPVR
jgi:hypothetical protein